MPSLCMLPVEPYFLCSHQHGSPPACYRFHCDISPLLRFHFWELIYYKEDDSNFPSDSQEALGHMVGIAEHVGHTMTYKVLTIDTQKVIYHSNLCSTSSSDPNLHVGSPW